MAPPRQRPWRATALFVWRDVVGRAPQVAHDRGQALGLDLYYDMPVDAAFKKRAEERRSRMVGGVARSFEELELASAQFWAKADYTARLKATHDALWEAWVVQGQHGPPPRFDGSTWGVLEFGR